MCNLFLASVGVMQSTLQQVAVGSDATWSCELCEQPFKSAHAKKRHEQRSLKHLEKRHKSGRIAMKDFELGPVAYPAKPGAFTFLLFCFVFLQDMCIFNTPLFSGPWSGSSSSSSRGRGESCRTYGVLCAGCHE